MPVGRSVPTVTGMRHVVTYAFLPLFLFAGSGPQAGSDDQSDGSSSDEGNTTASESTASQSSSGTLDPDSGTEGTTTPAPACGDGIVENGTFCFRERIDLAAGGSLVASDFDSDDIAELATGSCDQSPGFCIFEWDQSSVALAASSTESPGEEGCGLFLLRQAAAAAPALASCRDGTVQVHAITDGTLSVASEAALPEGPFYVPRPVTGFDSNADGVDEIIAQDYVDMDDAWDTPLLLRRDSDEWSYVGAPWPLASGNALRYPVAVGDLDGDGQDEAVLEAWTFTDAPPGHDNYDPETNQLVVMRSDGGEVSEFARFPAGTWPTAIQVADLNLDGHLDLIVRGYDRVGAATGVGDGTFDTVSLFDLVGYEFDGEVLIRGARAADADGDGDNELIVVVGPSAPAFADLVIVDDPLGAATQTTLAVSFAEGNPDTDDEIVARDLSGDGVADIAVTSNLEGSHRVSILVSDP